MDTLIAGLIYALLALDHMAMGPFMLSRPIVVGPVLGWYLGDAPMGFLIGSVVELMWMNVVQVGVWPIDPSVIAALSTVWTSLAGRTDRAAVTASLLLAIPCGLVVRHVDLWFRQQNDVLTPWVIRQFEENHRSVVARAVFFAQGFWMLKTWVVFLALAVLGRTALDRFFQVCPASLAQSFDFTGRVLPLAGFCAALNYFFARSKVNWSWIHRNQ